jgi:hypothetical protein
MKKTVQSKHVSCGIGSDLDSAARIKKMRVSALPKRLSKNANGIAGDEEQMRLHAAVAPLIGSIKSKSPRRAENAHALIRKSLRRRRVR